MTYTTTQNKTITFELKTTHNSLRNTYGCIVSVFENGRFLYDIKKASIWFYDCDAYLAGLNEAKELARENGLSLSVL